MTENLTLFGRGRGIFEQVVSADSTSDTRLFFEYFGPLDIFVYV